MPRPGSTIAHATLLERLHATGVYPSTVTIQTQTATRLSTGEKDPAGGWATLADHADLDCRVAPNRLSGGSGPRGGETRRPEGTIDVLSHTIALAGHYPSITVEHRAVVGSVTYDILAVDSDDETRCTYLLVEVVT